MEFFLQREIELRNFDKIREAIAANPVQLPVFLMNMIHIHQVVRMEDMIPLDVKDEMLMGIEDIFADYQQEVQSQELYFSNLDEEVRQNFLADFAKIYHNYLGLKQGFESRYLAGHMPIYRYAQCLTTIGEAERHLKPYMHNLGITDIHFN